MKKWPFILGIFCCSVLFFFSGTLVGYAVYDKIETKTANEPEKKKRIPSVVSGVVSPIIGRVIDKKTAQINAKLRIPSTPAIQKAYMYRGMINIPK